LNADVLQIKRGESPRDTSRVLSRYLDAMVVRANHHSDVIEMAGFADIPVINGLTDQEHPCQVLADLLTIMEHHKMKHPRELKGFRLVYLGDGNNVAQSWMLAASLLGMKLILACPKNYEPRKDYFESAQALSKRGGGSVEVISEPSQEVQGAQALYTDVWTSMGQESESQKRREALSVYQLNSFLLSMAAKNALVMHCLPAHRGEEITEDVIEGANSVVFDQAENRLHVQKAVMATLL
jgi:ornithine carbamoyltransferase